MEAEHALGRARCVSTRPARAEGAQSLHVSPFMDAGGTGTFATLDADAGAISSTSTWWTTRSSRLPPRPRRRSESDASGETRQEQRAGLRTLDHGLSPHRVAFRTHHQAAKVLLAGVPFPPAAGRRARAGHAGRRRRWREGQRGERPRRGGDARCARRGEKRERGRGKRSSPTLQLRTRSDRSERSGNNRCRVERASEDRRERVTKVLFLWGKKFVPAEPRLSPPPLTAAHRRLSPPPPRPARAPRSRRTHLSENSLHRNLSSPKSFASASFSGRKNASSRRRTPRRRSRDRTRARRQLRVVPTPPTYPTTPLADPPSPPPPPPTPPPPPRPPRPSRTWPRRESVGASSRRPRRRRPRSSAPGRSPPRTSPPTPARTSRTSI